MKEKLTILHYSIGVFPDRQGGLVRYSTDLALEQAKYHNVLYLIPGKLGIIDKTVRIVQDKSYNQLNVFRIENALPIPIYSGIKDIAIYTKPVDQGIYEQFFESFAVDIIHIHSLMGLHVELLRAAKNLSIRVVFTTHDYFGLCPTTSLFKNGRICDNTCINEKCWVCCSKAYSYLKLSVGQSRLYKKIKNKGTITRLRAHALSNNPIKSVETNINEENKRHAEYNQLNEYYQEIFKKIDYFLFNSIQTMKFYKKRIPNATGAVLPLILPSIIDNRRRRSFVTDGVLRIGFMGESTDFKGYYVLKEAVEEVVREGYKALLYVFNESVEESPIVKRMGKYTSSDLENIYDQLDIIIIPSICPETFSFSTMEALSFAMPCIVSDYVGAKDLIVCEQNGIIVPAGSVSALKNNIITIINNPNRLNMINDAICQMPFFDSFQEHSLKVINFYRS